MVQYQKLVSVTVADLIVRTAYQMGKTPLLPLFAFSLGASDAYLGFIVSVSTLTGMVLKPFIGIFSDRWGRRSWLLIGTCFFTVIPFTYHLVRTPEQLFVVRIIHGLATAIYGPVTLAYVAEQSPRRLAERIGWFGMARSGGYIIGPVAAGWLLLFLSPASVFTAIGFLSSLAFLPIVLLPESTSSLTKRHQHSPLIQQILQALKVSTQTPSIWLTGALESTTYIALYAVKTFLPIYALSVGINVALVGGFFAVQETTHLLLKPWGGRLGDRRGYLLAIASGLTVLSVALLLLPYAESRLVLLFSFVLMGIGKAMILPSTLAQVTVQIKACNMGASLGLIGTLKNAGKVAGPVIAGALIHWLSFTSTFFIISLILMLGAGLCMKLSELRSQM